jgi:GT2 family glycosyltransferase
LEVERGDKRALQFLDQHVAHFTWGLNYGNPDCRLPWASPYSFVPLPPPVVIDFWENAVEPTGPFTTIGNWRQAYRDIQFENRIYRWTKHQQFMRILDLPMRTDAPIELALSSYDGRDRLLLAEHGWRVRSALEFSQDPDAYHDYIVGSAGEISAAKEQNVHFRTGWFSERSAMYLAAGRPVIVQDTGFGAALPTGEGVFAFADLDEAVEAVAEVQADPARHRKAASDIAREYLSHEVVLGEMLDHVGLRPAVSRRKLPNSPAPAALPDELSLEVGSRRPFRLQDETAVYIAGRPVPAVVAPTGTPVVTVVVVARDNLACTRLTLESLLANTEEPPYEVIVVGGGSPEPSREYLEVLATRNRQVRLMSNDRGLSIAAGCNQGLEAAKSEICVLLDDDVVVTPKWLIDLVRHLDDPAIGFVAPATNRSRGTAEVPTSYTTWGELVRFSGRRRQELAGSPTRDIDVVDMSCVALRRGLFQAVGPLDARLENGSVADDYARRVRNSGHRVVCAAEIFAHRFDQASLGSLDDLSRSGDAPAEPSDPAAEGERTA